MPLQSLMAPSPCTNASWKLVYGNVFAASVTVLSLTSLTVVSMSSCISAFVFSCIQTGRTKPRRQRSPRMRGNTETDATCPPNKPWHISVPRLLSALTIGSTCCAQTQSIAYCTPRFPVMASTRSFKFSRSKDMTSSAPKSINPWTSTQCRTTLMLLMPFHFKYCTRKRPHAELAPFCSTHSPHLMSPSSSMIPSMFSGLSTICAACSTSKSVGTMKHSSSGNAMYSANDPRLPVQNATRVPTDILEPSPTHSTVPTPSPPTAAGKLASCVYCPRMKSKSFGWMGRPSNLMSTSLGLGAGFGTVARKATSAGSPKLRI
mmetsp:Transcript_13814/g.37459  ORF Transcript_13814/g.37459 Transcript_13814/m.37459 type:complete len:318 (+) Transcript_13814:112-1065(+)